MTATNQDFTVYAGDAAFPQFTVRDANGTPIDISTAVQISWNASRDVQSAPVLVKNKTTGGIQLVGGGTGGVFQLNLSSSDTQVLTGYYIHEAAITDSSGNVSTVTLGRMQVGRAPIATYSGDPANSPRDKVRMLIGDTNPAKPNLLDPEIDSLLSNYPNPYLAAAAGCRSIAARLAQKVNKRVGDLSINYSDMVKNYTSLATQLQSEGQKIGVIPYSGGISKADIRAVNANTDRPKPPFKRKQFDNPQGANQTTGDGWDTGSWS